MPVRSRPRHRGHAEFLVARARLVDARRAPELARSARHRRLVEVLLDRALELIGELARRSLSKNLMPLSSYRLCEALMTTPKSHSKRLRHVGDARRRQRADQHHVDAGGDEAGFERRLEHVAGEPRVLADQHRAAFGRQHARRGARQPQREIHRQRMLADAATHAIGAEVFTCHDQSSVGIACRAQRRLRLSRHRPSRATSCARTMRAPLSTAAVASATPPATRSSDRAAQQRLEHRLARHADQHRPAQRRPAPAGRASNARLCSRRLAEADTRIDHQPVARDAGRHGSLRALAQEVADFARRRRHSAGRACIVRGSPCMCMRQTARAAAGCGLERARLTQGAHVIDQAWRLRATAAVITAGLLVSIGDTAPIVRAPALR